MEVNNVRLTPFFWLPYSLDHLFLWYICALCFVSGMMITVISAKIGYSVHGKGHKVLVMGLYLRVKKKTTKSWISLAFN
jgi:hypothetical protein